MVEKWHRCIRNGNEPCRHQACRAGETVSERYNLDEIRSCLAEIAGLAAARGSRIDAINARYIAHEMEGLIIDLTNSGTRSQ